MHTHKPVLKDISSYFIHTSTKVLRRKQVSCISEGLLIQPLTLSVSLKPRRPRQVPFQPAGVASTMTGTNEHGHKARISKLWAQMCLLATGDDVSHTTAREFWVGFYLRPASPSHYIMEYTVLSLACLARFSGCCGLGEASTGGTWNPCVLESCAWFWGPAPTSHLLPYALWEQLVTNWPSVLLGAHVSVSSAS